MQILTYFPNRLTNTAIGHICRSVCTAMHSSGAEIHIYPITTPDPPCPIATDLLGATASRLLWKLGQGRMASRLSESLFLRHASKNTLAYVWPQTSRRFTRLLARNNIPYVLERINCHTSTAKRILDAEYQRLGLGGYTSITEDLIQQERDDLRDAKLVFSPSSVVRESLISEGVPPNKIIDSSYGWCPSRLAIPDRGAPDANKPFVALFVGLVCIRKGAHLLMDAWTRARLPDNARLLLVGNMTSEIETICSDALARPDIVHIPYTHDISKIYSEASVFAFPTLEEGSPLVSYEAASQSLPLFTSPMGGGSIFTSGTGARIMPAHETEQWISALKWACSHRDDLCQLGQEAKKNALNYTWEKVGQQRFQALGKALAIHTSSPSHL